MRKIELQAGLPPARITPHVMSPTPQVSVRETADRRATALWCETVHGRAARCASPLEPVLDDTDVPMRYRLRDGTGNGVSSSAAHALLDTHPDYEG